MGRAHGLALVAILASACPAGRAQPGPPPAGRAAGLHAAVSPDGQELADAARGAIQVRDPTTPAMDEPPAPQPAPDLLVDFACGSARLTPTVTRALDAFGRTLLADAPGAPRVRVEGFADTVGSRDANRDLAARRAQAVAGYLELVGLPSERLDIAASPTLLVPTPDGTASAANRRVRVTEAR